MKPVTMTTLNFKSQVYFFSQEQTIDKQSNTDKSPNNLSEKTKTKTKNKVWKMQINPK